MNMSINKSFRNIKGAISAYQTSITNTFNRYKIALDKAKAESGKYKAENEYFAEKKTACANTARAEIESARETLKSTMQGEVDSLKAELADHLMMRPNSAFLDSLKVYRDYQLELSRAEVEGLIKLNGGAALGYRCLNKVLEDTHSNLRVSVPDIADYEADIGLLERISTAPLWSTTENYPEFVSVFNGTQRENAATGITWDRTGLLISRNDFDSKINKLADMESRWSATVTPSLKTIELYEEKDGKTPTEQYAEDIKAVSDGAGIEHSEGETVLEARLMGAARAAEDAKAAKVMSLYASR